AYSAAAMAALGSVIGSLFLFFLARKGGEAYLAYHSTGPKGARLRAWFLEYGLLTILVPAIMPIVPLPLKVFVVCAGALGVNPFVFTLVMAVCRVIRYFALAWLGLRLGDRTLPFLLHHWWEFLLFAIFLFASLYYLVKRRDRKRKLHRLVVDTK
ncbi:MAG: YqaA family protein, partial [bacterium]